MLNSAVQDFITGQLAEKAGGVTDKPRVERPTTPSPFEDTRMDISDRFRPVEDLTSADAFYQEATTGGSDGDRYFTGDISVTGLGANVEDRFTGAPRELSGTMAMTGLSGFMGIGSAMSLRNLTNIQNKMRAGEQGYAVGIFNGRIVGVSPGPFGGYTLSGVLPEGLTPQQRNQLAEQLLAMGGNRPVETAPGLGGPAGDVPDPDTGITVPEALAGAGEGGTSTPVGSDYDGPYASYLTSSPPPPTAGDPGDDSTSANITFLDTGADRPSPDYTPPPSYDYYGDPGDDSSSAGTPSQSCDNFTPQPDDPAEEGGGPGVNDGGQTPDSNSCCFIMLEARYADGTMDEVVRRYRDEHMADRNKRGYYKVAEVLVPLMRKSRLAKWLVTKTFADPLVSYGKYYYGQNKHGVIFAPVKSFWMSVFNIVGGETEFIRENGKVV